LASCWLRELKRERRVESAPDKENIMRKTILTAAALVLFSSAAMAQSTETKAPATTGPAAQSGDNMAKGDMSKGKTSNKKATKSKSMKKTN
jgi:hypothetical protein